MLCFVRVCVCVGRDGAQLTCTQLDVFRAVPGEVDLPLVVVVVVDAVPTPAEVFPLQLVQLGPVVAPVHPAKVLAVPT